MNAASMKPSSPSTVSTASRSNEGSAYPAVRPEAFARANVVIPSAPVLSSFEDSLQPLFERVGENERQIKTLAALRDALLPQLMSGELRIPQAETLLEHAT